MKIKVAVLAGNLYVNGVSNVIKNYCEKIDLQKFDITILAGNPIDDGYRELYKNLGIRLLELPARKQKTLAYYKALYKKMRQGRYDILHVHGNSVNSSVELFIGLLAGIKVRIMHSHNTICNNRALHTILLPFFKKVCTQRFACGEKAGAWIYGSENFHIIPNGFETEKFRFSPKARNAVREKLKLENHLVIGHIGRINHQKNQPYLLDIFEKLAKAQPDAMLLLVGTGPDYDMVNNLVLQHPYKERIILYGETDDAASMYSAMDVFVLPSRHEGLPIVLLEAQMSGLPCVVSDKVTKEVDFGEIEWKSIEDLPGIWADTILKKDVDTTKRDTYYDTHIRQIEKYDIKENVKLLERLYSEMYTDAYR